MHACFLPRGAVTHCPLVSTVGYGSWFEHVQEFWEHRMDSNVLFLKYEDMHRVSVVGCARGHAGPAHPVNAAGE